MRILVLALALLPAAAIAEDRDPVHPPAVRSARPGCGNAEIHRAEAARTPVRPGTLGQQPAADQYLAVLRLESGCDKPVMIRQNVGDGIHGRR